MDKPKGKIQFVWYSNPLKWGLGYARPGTRRTVLGYVYRWILVLGPIDIRRWETRTLDEVREANENGFHLVLLPFVEDGQHLVQMFRVPSGVRLQG